jgi:hypothetical protein
MQWPNLEPVKADTQPDRAKTMGKTALPILLAIIIPNAAIADVVRHDSIPGSYWGASMATGSDRLVFELSAKSYANNEASCAVNWISGRAVRRAIRDRRLQALLPACLPYLNPIEHSSPNKMKAPVRAADPRTGDDTWRHIGALFALFTPAECAN